MDIENNSKYGLTRSHFSKVACLYNEDKIKKQYYAKCSKIVQNVNAPAVTYNQIEVPNQNMCIENNKPIENQDAYVNSDSAVDVGIDSLDRLNVEESELCVSSDVNLVANSTYDEEASYEDKESESRQS